MLKNRKDCNIILIIKNAFMDVNSWNSLYTIIACTRYNYIITTIKENGFSSVNKNKNPQNY